MTNNKQLIAWLNDAYSMERSLANVLENHARDAADFPDAQARNEQHLAETRQHADLVERCLEMLGETPSTVKSAFGSLMGRVEGAASGVFRDEIVKNFLSDYAAEHLEIASYKALVVAAEEVGQPEIARICGKILAEEVAMAEWLENHLPGVTRQSLHQLADAGR
jgi:ferritin-like metal-binding protein YciE